MCCSTRQCKSQVLVRLGALEVLKCLNLRWKCHMNAGEDRWDFKTCFSIHWKRPYQIQGQLHFSNFNACWSKWLIFKSKRVASQAFWVTYCLQLEISVKIISPSKASLAVSQSLSQQRETTHFFRWVSMLLLSQSESIKSYRYRSYHHSEIQSRSALHIRIKQPGSCARWRLPLSNKKRYRSSTWIS